jgi:YD repeat-containing protein
MPRVGLESLSITDAAGQTTTYTYNARHQPLTITNAKNETTTYAYDATSGRLTSITGPVSGAMTAYTYDAYGRVRTTTDSDGYTVTLDYDTFDRPRGRRIRIAPTRRRRIAIWIQ